MTGVAMPSETPNKGEEAFIHGVFHGSLCVIFFTPWVLSVWNRKVFRSDFGESLLSDYTIAAFISAVLATT
jgi:hypothetical protein